MKANELRIGNYVQIEGVNKPIRLYVIDTTESSTFTKAKPIPLTEEWLLKFGFEFNMCSKFWIDKLCVHVKDNEFYILYEQGRVWIEYVHQLQNLYFALTGKELEIL